MANCATGSNYVGKNVIIGVVPACGDEDPQAQVYLPIGYTNQKDLTVGSQTTDNTSDDTSGVTSSLVTFLEVSITAAGFASQSDSITSNQAAIKKYHVGEVVAGRQPTYWVQVIYPDVTYYVFANVTSTGTSAPTTDAVTFSYEFTATATPGGSAYAPVIVVDTL